MAQPNTKVSKAPKQPTSTEMRNWYMNHKSEIEEFADMKTSFAKAMEPLKTLVDVTKRTAKTITVFDRERLRTFLQNITSNEANLRALSWFLYYQSQPYRRLINYHANAFCLYARSVIPTSSLTKANKKNKVLKSYNDTIDVLDRMHLQYEMFKMFVIAWVQDVAYGCIYYDEVGMFILPLPADICRIDTIYQTSDFGFAVDMSYFRSRENLVEMWGEPWVSMKKLYDQDNQNNRWVHMPDEYAVCLKVNADDYEIPVPPYAGMFEDLIGLKDLVSLQPIADKQEIYKLVWMEMETLNNKLINDWKVDPEIYISYFNRLLNEALPDYIAGAIVPGKLEQISFQQDNQTTETTKIANTTKTLFNTAGGAQILNSATLNNTVAIKASIISDQEYTISSLLPQTEGFVNRFLSYYVTTPSKVKFFPITAYTKDEYRESLEKMLNYGLPVVDAIMSLYGYDPKDVQMLAYLQNEVFDYPNTFKPLQTSATQSANEPGGQEKPDSEISDDGLKSREKKANS